MFKDFSILIIGLSVLVFAADQFLNGAARLAERFKVPKALVGALLVGFGTSAPELAASLTAVFQQEVGGVELAVGNIVGSNVANLGLVLAIPVLIWGNVIPPHGTREQAGGKGSRPTDILKGPPVLPDTPPSTRREGPKGGFGPPRHAQPGMPHLQWASPTSALGRCVAWSWGGPGSLRKQGLQQPRASSCFGAYALRRPCARRCWACSGSSPARRPAGQYSKGATSAPWCFRVRR